MKLCIVKPDGSNEEIPFKAEQPSLDKIDSNILLFENYPYKLIIRCDVDLDSAEMFVGDYSEPLTYNEDAGCYETEKKWIFNDCYDLTYVSINVDDGYGEEKVYYTDYLRIATTKQTARQVEHMLDEIEKNLPSFLSVCFSRSKKQSGLIKNDVRSIWNTLKIVDEITCVYEENYGYFCNHKNSSVEHVDAVVDIKSMCKIDQESLIWIASNPENLVSSEGKSIITINDKGYMPSRIKTRIPQYSYDVYENKVVLGFLKSVILYIEKQISGFNREISEVENVPESIVIQLPNTHELTGRCIFIYYKGVLDKYIQRRDILQEIYYRYERILDCTPEVIYSTPKLSNTFKQVYHYRLCYECMVKWFELGDYSFDHLNYLFKLKALSRIFQYYCLIKLQKAIIRCGYSFVEGNRISYSVEDDEEEINNQYKFVGNGQEIVLLYEPSIWVDRVSEEINLYSTGFNFIKGIWNDQGWTPDFVIKITSNNRQYYYILDAKYSNIRNVKTKYIPELVLKYGVQIASKDKFFSDVIGVGALYPSAHDKIDYYKKSKIDTSKQSLPKYFALTIVEDEVGNNALKERMLELLNVVESLEEERKPIAGSKSVHQREVVQENILPNSNIKGDVVLEENVADSKALFTEVELDKEKSAYEKVNGKKCFYYGRGMCLCKKIRCEIIDDPCESYVHKNSKDLLSEEDTCRNFIRYTRKGRVKRVECSVSGLPGCVGVVDCKFCLKKKDNKTQ